MRNEEKLTAMKGLQEAFEKPETLKKCFDTSSLPSVYWLTWCILDFK
jgi:hypothetical protein